MIDIIVIACVVAAVAAAAGYVYRSKKRGVKCIGCPSGGNCQSCCGCGH